MDFGHICMGCLEDKGAAAVCPHCHRKETSTPDSSLYLSPRSLLKHRYLMGRVLNQGKFGISYIGVDTNSHQKIVIKEFFPHDIATRLPENPNLVIKDIKFQRDFSFGLNKFIDEGRALKKIKFIPGLAKTIFNFRNNGTAYRIMEYVDGITLSKYLSQHRGHISFQKILKILNPVITALNFVHARGLLHFDIYPDNIIVRPDETGTLINFSGTNYVIAQRWEILSSILRQGYSPPELCQKIEFSGPWSDVYALAATIYRALIGQTTPDVISRIEDDQLTFPATTAKKVSPEITNILMKALKIEPQNRFQTIRTFREGLLHAWYSQERKTKPLAKNPFTHINCEFCGMENEVLTIDLQAGTAICLACHRGLLADKPEEKKSITKAVSKKERKRKPPKAQLVPPKKPPFKVTRKKAQEETPFVKIRCASCNSENEVLASDLNSVAVCLVCGQKLNSREISTVQSDPKLRPPISPSSSADLQESADTLEKSEGKLFKEPQKKRKDARPAKKSRRDKKSEEVEHKETEDRNKKDAPAETLETLEKEVASAPAKEPLETLSDVEIPDKVFDLLGEPPRKIETETPPDKSQFSEERQTTVDPEHRPENLTIYDRVMDLFNHKEKTEDLPDAPEDNVSTLDLGDGTVITDQSELYTEPTEKSIDPTEETSKEFAKEEEDHFQFAETETPDISGIKTEIKPSEDITEVDCPKCGAHNSCYSSELAPGVKCSSCNYPLVITPIADKKIQETFRTRRDRFKQKSLKRSGTLLVRVSVAASLVIIIALGFYFIKPNNGNKENEAYSRHLEQADVFFRQGKYQDALMKYQTALNLKSGDPYILGQVTRCQAIIEQVQQTALLPIQKKEPKKPTPYQIFTRQADSLFRLKKYTKAKALYKKALADSSKDVYVRNRLAEIGKLLLPQPTKVVKVKKRNLINITPSDNLKAIIDSAVSNTTIHLSEGIFKLFNPVIISKSLQIEGSGFNHTLIISDVPETMISVEKGVKLTLSKIALEYNGQTWGNILHVNNAQISVDSCAFKGAVFDEESANGGAGILLSGESYGDLSDNLFTDNYSGIHIKNASKPILKGNNIRNNKIGIIIADNARPKLENNYVHQNQGNGIEVAGSAQPNVKKNKVSANDENGFFFTTNSSHYSGILKDNEIYHNKKFGVLLVANSQPTLEENRIYMNDLGGLHFKENARGIVRHNKIVDNKKEGIRIENSAKPTLKSNYIKGNGGDGIEILHKAQPIIEGNEIIQNRGNGIDLHLSEPGGYLRNNNCTGNLGYGISILTASQPTLINNLTMGNNEGEIYKKDILD